jgi:hypothetical protein
MHTMQTRGRPARARPGAKAARAPLAAPLLLLLRAGVAALLSLPAPALAHVKWFAPFDVTEPPMPIHAVLSGRFPLVFAGFAFLIALGFALDRLAARSGRGGVLALSRGNEEVEERLLRAGTGAFFVALFTAGGAILTPELRTEAAWPSWLQFGIAASMVSARSCVLGAAGILALYGYGAALYGAFHVADYPFFLGIAAYLALTSSASERLRRLRMPVLQAAFCASLMWAAVEKWAYPQWTFPLLETRPWLTFGLLPSDFMVLAGFVEFAFAFHILTGFGLMRLGVLGLGSIFAAAVLDFGKLDAIGHLPLMAAMAAMFVHGPTPLQRRLHIRSGLLSEARRAGLAFAAAVCVFVSAYYGLQRAEYGHGPAERRLAAAAPAEAPSSLR